MNLPMLLCLVLLSVAVPACTTETELEIVEEQKHEKATAPDSEVEEQVSETSARKPEATPKHELPQNNGLTTGKAMHDPSLIAYLPFDDTADDIVNGYNGRLPGDAEFRPGKINNALLFDGSDDFVALPSEALEAIGGLKQGTIAFWLNYNSLLDSQPVMPIFYTGIDEASSKEENMYIIEIGHAAGTEAPFDNRYPEGTPDPTNKRIYSTWIKNGQEPFLCSDSEVSLEENEWQHFAVVAGPTGNTLYLNGKEVVNRDYNFGHSTDKAFLADIPVKEIMTIGYGRSHKWISPDFVYFKGMLDDFRIYDRPLDAQEIQQLHSMADQRLA
jgi:hypothetical protein